MVREKIKEMGVYELGECISNSPEEMVDDGRIILYGDGLSITNFEFETAPPQAEQKTMTVENAIRIFGDLSGADKIQVTQALTDGFQAELSSRLDAISLNFSMARTPLGEVEALAYAQARNGGRQGARVSKLHDAHVGIREQMLSRDEELLEDSMEDSMGIIMVA